MRYAIQCISTATLRRAQGYDVEWGYYYDLARVDYTDHASVAEAVALLELDADGAYRYRIVEVASVDESYQELEAENIDALEALGRWYDAGCPNDSAHLAAMRTAAQACVERAPVKVVRGRAISTANDPGEEREAS